MRSQTLSRRDARAARVRPYRVVDVFADRPLEGNPLTVVLDADDLPAATMQRIAREANHSETAFVREPRNGAWPVRIFTPAVELPFAGHPVLGTAAVLMAERGATSPVVLDVPAGRVPVTREGDVYWMTQRPPEFLNMAQPAFAARALGLDPLELDARAMPQAVSTGVPFLVVPVERLASLERAEFSLARLRDLLPRVGADLVCAFSTETRSEADLHVRCFTAAVGIPEDPATGSAAGCLAAYLAEHEFLGPGDVDVVAEQGLEIGRPSRLYLRAKREGASLAARVGGRVVPVADGTLRL